MAESFALDSLVIPGAYVQVRADALIAGAAVSTGNIGIVGTAGATPDATEILSGYDDAVNAFGAYDAFSSGKKNLTRGLELAYRNGGGVTFARGLAAGAGQDDFTAAFEKLIKDDVNILIAPELSTADALAVLGAVLEEAENNGRDAIAVVGTDKTAVADIVAEVPDNDRIIFVAPGIQAFDSAARANVKLRGRTPPRRWPASSARSCRSRARRTRCSPPCRHSSSASPTARRRPSCRRGRSSSRSAAACGWCAG